MKSTPLIGLATVSLLSLSACSQNTPSKTQSSQSSKSYYVQKQAPAAPQVSRVVYRQPTRTAPKPAYRQKTPQQQVVHKQVQKPAAAKPTAAQNQNAELYAIGNKIFQNEAGGRVDQLVHWNHREDFAAMGIGHFTWYPSGRKQRFGNTFPGLLDYLKSNDVQLPQWVQRARFEGAPWRTRAELMQAKNTPEVKQFAQLLYNTRHLQAKYIMDRAMRAMPKLVNKTPPHLRQHVAKNLNDVANSHGGRYVLVDYVNFKGEGLNRTGGYKGQNWGLLQVLEEMRPANGPGQQALNQYADAAMRVLERRVKNSNPSRNEKKWLPGWRNRTNTYRNPV